MDENDYSKLLDIAIEQIPEDAKDTKRWIIPKLDVDYEGKTTIIKNFKQIVTELGCDEKHFFKKICKELGAAGDIQKSSGRAVLKSILKKSSLNSQIENYTRDYIICQTCGKPDTVIIKDGRNHVLKCQACGTRRMVKL
jgi:translation initiation factor 2 subunit 2